MIVAFIVWAFCAVFCAMGAASRGRSVVAWFLLGFLLGPLALLGIIVAGPVREVQAAATPAPLAGSTKRCPACAESIQASATVCRFCGRQFDQTEVESAVQAAAGAMRRAARPADVKVVLALLLAGGVGVWLYQAATTQRAPVDGLRPEVLAACFGVRPLALARLRLPADSDHEACSSADIRETGDDRWVVRAWAQAPASAGGKRRHYTATARKSGSTWLLDDFQSSP